MNLKEQEREEYIQIVQREDLIDQIEKAITRVEKSVEKFSPAANSTTSVFDITFINNDMEYHYIPKEGVDSFSAVEIFKSLYEELKEEYDLDRIGIPLYLDKLAQDKLNNPITISLNRDRLFRHDCQGLLKDLRKIYQEEEYND